VAGSTHPGEEELILQALSHKAPGSIRLILAPRHEGRAKEVLGLVKIFGLKGRLLSEMESGREGRGEIVDAAARGNDFQEESSLEAFVQGAERQAMDGDGSDLRGGGGLDAECQGADGRLEKCQVIDGNEVIVIDQVGMLARLYEKASLCVIGGSFFRSSGHNPLEPAAYGRPVVFGPGMDSFALEAKALVSAGAAREATKDNLRESLDFFLSNSEASAKAGLAGLKMAAKLTPVAPVLAKLIVQACYPELSPSSKAPGSGPFGGSPDESLGDTLGDTLGDALGDTLGDALGGPHDGFICGSLNDPLGLAQS
jgi:hypothetical protein